MMTTKLNVLQMIKEQKQKEDRKHQAALCQIGQCKTAK
jgi:hypothetical protein